MSSGSTIYLLERDDNERPRLKEFDGTPPPYAILSHTWGEEEVTFKDIQEGTGQRKSGYKKIQFYLDTVAADGLRYCWVDTCCIDKADSARLQIAINSMFRWYRDASRCYVFLADVPEKLFKDSRWFKRGWTLQELIAPGNVEFFSSERVLLGDKRSMLPTLGAVTGIPIRALEGSSLTAFSFDERIRWIGLREAKYEEDLVYSLLGILEVSMPLNYGEGRETALIRLREQYEGGSIGEAARSCLRKWRLTDPRDDRSRILATKDRLLEGSCDWIFRDTAFEKWWAADNAPVLWIHGDPGKGKTIIMTAIIDEISQRL